MGSKKSLWLSVMSVPLLITAAAAGEGQTTVKKSGPPPTQSGPANGKGSWEVQCAEGPSGPVCKASQTLVVAETRQLLLAVSVSKAAADKNSAMLVHLPHGLFPPAGITVGVDGAAAEKLVIQTCDVQGCYAGAGLAPDKIESISKGTKLKVSFEDLQKQKIVVQLPLKGFEAAYKKL